jgi:hypothetical protein
MPVGNEDQGRVTVPIAAFHRRLHDDRGNEPEAIGFT